MKQIFFSSSHFLKLVKIQSDSIPHCRNRLMLGVALASRVVCSVNGSLPARKEICENPGDSRCKLLPLAEIVAAPGAKRQTNH